MVTENDFWRKRSGEELAAEQGIKPADDLDVLIGQGSDLWESDEDFDAFLEGIYERRAQSRESVSGEKSGAA